MARTAMVDRRVSDMVDRRQFLGRGGRRAYDRQAAELELRIACQACGAAWASLSSVNSRGAQYVAEYLCPRCSSVERRAVAAP